jgi:acyl-CoA thioester hydrolase
MSPNAFEVTLSIPVRTYDVDFIGYVSNIVYVRWLEDLRLQILADHFPLNRAIEELGIAPVLVRTEIDYKRPIRLFDVVLGRMWVGELGRVRQVLQAEFTVDGELRAAARQITCFVDVKTGRAQPTPDALMLARQPGTSMRENKRHA